MSSKPQNSSPDADDDAAESGAESANAPAANPLQIALPDGSESVSDAIVTHREMLREPQEHGLATEEDITHLSEAMESLSGTIQETTRRSEESQARIAELEELVETQERQIEELQSMVDSLAGILGTETEWRTVDDA
jgi:chromosome segregation ATPase